MLDLVSRPPPSPPRLPNRHQIEPIDIVRPAISKAPDFGKASDDDSLAPPTNSTGVPHASERRVFTSTNATIDPAPATRSRSWRPHRKRCASMFQPQAVRKASATRSPASPRRCRASSHCAVGTNRLASSMADAIEGSVERSHPFYRTWGTAARDRGSVTSPTRRARVERRNPRRRDAPCRVGRRAGYRCRLSAPGDGIRAVSSVLPARTCTNASPPSNSTSSTRAAIDVAESAGVGVGCRSSGRTPRTTRCPFGAPVLAGHPPVASPNPCRLESSLAQATLDQVHRRGADEARDEGVAGALVQRRRRVHLLHRALVHHHDAVAQRHRLDLVVRDVDHRGAELLMKPRDLAPHLHAQLGVEIGQRLVEEKHLRLSDDRPAERDALALRRRTAAAAGGASNASMPRIAAASRTRPSISLARQFRSLSAKAMFSCAVMCG